MQDDRADITIRAIKPADAAVWESMRTALWPDGAEDHGPEITQFFSGQVAKDLAAVLVAKSQSILGFAELSVRDDVPGLEGRRTGYVEGLYVLPEVRHCGIARQLLRASRAWASKQMCEAFASDRADRLVIDKSFR